MGNNWYFQWSKYKNDEDFVNYDNTLFQEWIYPYTFEDFRDRTVLDCGCGRGQHLKFVLPYSKEVAGIDLNTTDVAKEYLNNKKAKFIAGDIAKVELNEKYDIVYSIGVLHHTDNPDESFRNISKFVNKGGKLIVWVYSHEGNFLNRLILEPAIRHIFNKINSVLLLYLSYLMTLILYIPIYTIYLLPLRFMPFYKYFANFRKLSFKRNVLNVFDKVNAPQTHFIRKDTLRKWFSDKEFTNVHISSWNNVSWRASGIKI